MNADELYSGFAQDPRVPAHAGLRASDSDRERIRAVLADAFADGRLDRGEYDERADALVGTRSLGDLPVLVSDLVPVPLEAATPADLHARAVHTWEVERRRALLRCLGPSLICWVIWLATSLGSGGLQWPWPLFVTLGTAFPAIRTLVSRDDTVEEELRRLQRAQARALRPEAE
jgi:hypothetical protein